MALSLHVRAYGEGRPLVILHGLYGSGHNWNGIARKLAEQGFAVHAMDLRNHGASLHRPSMTYVAMAADVLQTLAEQGVLHASFIGHSMGGKTAMMLALMMPEAIDRLVVADIAPVDYTGRGQHGAHRGWLDAMLALDVQAVGARSQADHLLSTRIPDHHLRAFLLSNLVYRDGQFHWRVNLEAINQALPDILNFNPPPGRQFAGPTLFISGSQSDYFGQDDWIQAQALFPAAQWQVIEGARHWLHVDAPDTTFDAIFAFLSSSGQPMA
jgi:pimeloyl-ACP methyl ester carboxylesterase